jgi:hypothetical protein
VSRRLAWLALGLVCGALLLVWGWGKSFEWWIPPIAGLIIGAAADLWRLARRSDKPPG